MVINGASPAPFASGICIDGASERTLRWLGSFCSITSYTVKFIHFSSICFLRLMPWKLGFLKFLGKWVGFVKQNFQTVIPKQSLGMREIIS
jgi:hypothetical protein